MLSIQVTPCVYENMECPKYLSLHLFISNSSQGFNSFIYVLSVTLNNYFIMEKACDNWSLYSQRLNSFKNWKGDAWCEELAEAGLYSIGDDTTICFSCKQEFKEWKKFEIPWLVHWCRSPYCNFLKKNWGKVQEERNKISIANLMTSNGVENLIKNGEYTSDEINDAIHWYLKDFGIIPRTLKGIETVTKRYIDFKNCKQN